ncbi:MAG: coproporphyrinogen III oxidase, partial [Dysgonamonadaceae bacterium]|nr:coproporphyrinogen III oxidase [Dysgonamonadaceae bacterium]
NIEEYISLIDKGLATVKGYLLNAEEQIVREVIETLMCNYCIDWNDLSARLGLPVEEIKRATTYNADVMSSFAEDGLIDFDENHIEIRPEAHLFVRNAAASLDPLLKNTDRTFSRPV